MAITHCIEDFQLEIAFSSEAQTRREQGRLAQWLSDDLLPAMDALFSSQSPGQKYLRFERLEFDLGLVQGASYQQQIKQQLLEKLTTLLRDRRLELPDTSTGLLPSPEAGRGARALEQLMVFLRTGQLPWHSDTSEALRSRDELDEVTRRAVETSERNNTTRHHQQLLAGLLNHPGLVDALRALPEREQLVQRLVSQFPDEQLSALLKSFSPDFFRELVPLWQLLSKLRDSNNLGGTGLKKIWWKNILYLWLDREHVAKAAGKSADSTAIHWPAKLLRNLAAEVNLPAATLYQQLLNASQQNPVAHGGEFVRYLRGQPLASPARLAAGRLNGQRSAGSATNTVARELRYQLAQIFNGGQGDALALLWPELLAHHTNLLRAALNHYLAIPSVRQKLVLQFPLDLLGNIVAFLKPEWALAREYVAIAEGLAKHAETAAAELSERQSAAGATAQATGNHDVMARDSGVQSLVITASAADIERDLWEISFNHYIHATHTSREIFLARVLAELAYRLGADPNVLRELVQREFTASENRSPVGVSTSASAAIGEVNRPEMASVQAKAQVKNPEQFIPLPMLAEIQKTLARELTRNESQVLGHLLVVLLALKEKSPVDALEAEALVSRLREAESLPDNIIDRFFSLLERDLVPAGFQFNNLELTNRDLQLLSKYGVHRRWSASTQDDDLKTSITETISAQEKAIFSRNSLPAVAAGQFDQDLPEVDFPASEVSVPQQEQATSEINQNQDLRWQEFLRQLQRGHIVLGDLHLNDSSGLQMVAHYLNQAGHIKSEYRQNLLASISSMSCRAMDTAEYFRRVIHCLIYQQPVDFEEILQSKAFWKTREKAPATSKPSDWDDAVVVETVEQKQYASPLVGQRSDQHPAQQTGYQADVTYTAANAVAANKNILVDAAFEADKGSGYEQQLWALLQHIRQSASGVFHFSLEQLQQLVEFHLVNSPELADDFRAELALAIARGANAIPDADTRFNYYANVLERLLAASDIDITDPQLRVTATWVKRNHTQVNNLHSELDQDNAAGDVSLETDMSFKTKGTRAQEYNTGMARDVGAQSQPVNTRPLEREQLVYLWRQMQIGEADLDDQQLNDTEWLALIDVVIGLQNSEGPKTDFLDLLSADVIAANKRTEFYRQWLRQRLQSASLNMLAAEGVKSTSENPVDTLMANARSAVSLPRDQYNNLREILKLAEAAYLTEADSTKLSQLLALLTSGKIQVYQLPASLSQLKALVQFLIAKGTQFGRDYRNQLQREMAAVKVEEHQYYTALLQQLVNTKDDRVVDGSLSDAATVTSDNAITSILPARQNSETEAAHAHAITGFHSIADAGDNSKREINTPLARATDALSLATLLAAAENYPQQLPDNASFMELIRLCDLLSEGQMEISQLHAGWQQLAGLTRFFVDNRLRISPVHRAQLNSSIAKYAEQAQHKRDYLAAVLYRLVSGAEVDLETLSAQAETVSAKRIGNAGIEASQHMAAASMASASSIEPGPAIEIDQVVVQTRRDAAQPHEYKIQSNRDDIQINKPVAQTNTAVVEAQTNPQPVASDHQSLLELMQLSSLTQAQSIRLQQLLQTALNRGKADPIKLWFNNALGEAPRLRLVSLLPDYALHQLLRLAYPAAYEQIYPQVKIVLDAIAVVAPHTPTVQLHREKWLFIIHHCLVSGASKPDHKKLFAFAQSLAKAAAIGDLSQLEKLLQDRLNLQASEHKASEEKQGTKTEALLQEALQEGIHISNAGQVLAAPYMGRLFSMLGLTDQGAFMSLAAKDRAVHLLEYMVTGSSATPEYDLLLNKVLCGMGTSIPISAGIEITEQEEAIIGQLLNSIIQNWKAIGATSITGLRETFLRRQGWLRLDEDGWHLHVQPGPFDMLLDQLPWSISLIKQGWMDQPLRVSWRK